MGELREVFEKGPLHNEVDALKFKSYLCEGLSTFLS